MNDVGGSALNTLALLDYGAFGRSGIVEPAEHFERCGYIPLPQLIPPSTLDDLRAEIDRLEPEARRRDFQMECMGGTPRHMTTLGGLLIAELAPRIAMLYANDQLQSEMSRLIGRQLAVADDPVERHVLNILHKPGDTHGFHVDDYPVALVMFVESPTCPDGCGMLEFCPAEGVDSGQPESGHSQTRAHQAGDAYLLRSDRLKHRVQPIHEGCRRTVLNFAYAVEGETIKQTSSASQLYS